MNEINWNIFNISKELAISEEKKFNFIELPQQKIIKLPVNNETIIIGIDFGTINSGYSFSIDNDTNKINLKGKSPNEIETSKNTQLGQKISFLASSSLPFWL